MVDKKRLVRNLKTAIKQLAAELADLDSKIEILESTLQQLGGRSGRSKAKAGKRSSTSTSSKAKKKSNRKAKRKWTPEMRKAAADRMRDYWAKRKAEGKS